MCVRARVCVCVCVCVCMCVRACVCVHFKYKSLVTHLQIKIQYSRETNHILSAFIFYIVYELQID